MAQPRQHGDAKYRDCNDPSRLRDAQLRRAVAHFGATHRDVPRHVMPAREDGRISALSRVRDKNDRPGKRESPIRNDRGTQGACQPPELGGRIRRKEPAIDEEEEGKPGGPGLERQLEMRDLRSLDLVVEK